MSDHFSTYYLVTWHNTEYNYNSFGNDAFNGTTFTAPTDGIYSFYVTVRQTSINNGRVCIYHNDSKEQTIVAKGICNRHEYRNGHISVQATVLLRKGELVYVGLNGYLSDLGAESTTYFEGRLISKIDISKFQIEKLPINNKVE